MFYVLGMQINQLLVEIQPPEFTKFYYNHVLYMFRHNIIHIHNNVMWD